MPRNMSNSKAKAVIVSLAFLLSGTGFLMAQPVSATSFNNVQIFANPISSNAHDFRFSAYNLTGDLVATYEGPYSAAAFELPAGEYLFTVSASDFVARIGYLCPLAQGGATGSGSATPAATANGTKSGAAIFPTCYPQSSEYGYSLSDVTGSQSINIDLQNASTLPTAHITVKVSYVNGTAASGAYVYASVVGEWYYWWWYRDASINMSAQTDSSGVAHLIVPVAPTVITAWKWVPVFTKTNATSQVNVGGQEVNVTAYWDPTYIGLSGSGLIIPPQTSVGITLHYQQPEYWVMAGGVASRGAQANGVPSATEASQPGGTPSMVTNSNAQSPSQPYTPSKIPALQVARAEPVGNQLGLTSTDIVIIGAVAFVAVALGVVFAATRLRPKSPPVHQG